MPPKRVRACGRSTSLATALGGFRRSDDSAPGRRVPRASGTACPFWLCAQGNALSGEIHIEHVHVNRVAHLDDLVRISDEMGSELRDVDKTVLVHSEIHERSECGHVRHDSFELHAGGEVLDLSDVVAESRCLEC